MARTAKRPATFSRLDVARIVAAPPTSAIYYPTKRKAHAGNPLIEAIKPPPKDDDEAAERMSLKPDYDPDETPTLGKRERLDRIEDLDDLHVPTTWHTQKEQRLTSVLVKGLRSRNPLTAEGSTDLILASDKLLIWRDPAQRPEGSIILLDGMSGMGKTSFFKAIARCWGGPVIRHERYGDRYFAETQIVYLKVNCPGDRSLKGLARNLLFSIVQLIGPDKDLINTLLNPHVTQSVLTTTLRVLIATYHIGMLVIDEIRNLFLRTKRGGPDNFKPEDSEIVAFLLNLRDEVKIPIVLIGTPEAAEHLDTSLSMNRRLTQDGEFTMVPPRDATDPDWILLCTTMWRYQWTLRRTELTPDIIGKLFYFTTGITGLLIALFQASQRLAIQLEPDHYPLDEDLLTLAYTEGFKRLHPIIDRLREGDATAKAKWSDLWIPNPKADEAP
jgi:hypothetical protein